MLRSYLIGLRESRNWLPKHASVNPKSRAAIIAVRIDISFKTLFAITNLQNPDGHASGHSDRIVARLELTAASISSYHYFSVPTIFPGNGRQPLYRPNRRLKPTPGKPRRRRE